jgi:prepilin-type N-terminal cleavage/methylation domain-containing protein
VIARRLRAQDGFGLVELLIAMTVMAIGIMAIVAGFSSGIVAVSRASRIGTAGTLADKQMEAYRALPYAKIALRSTLVGAAASPYTSDPAYSATLLSDTVLSGSTTAYDGSYCNTSPVTCQPVQSSVTGPDGRTYRVDSFIVWYCAAGTLRTAAYNGTTYSTASPGCTDTSTPPVDQARAAKQVTVVVRDATTTSKTYVRETSVFDQAT